MEEEKITLLVSSEFDKCIKIILSQPKSKIGKYKRIVVNYIGELKKFQFEKYTETQVFHENIDPDSIKQKIETLFFSEFSQLNIWTEQTHYHYILNIKGKVNVSKKKLEKKIEILEKNNREKRYILEEGIKIAPLIDLGILTSEGKIVNKQFDKFKQVNRFIEQIDDAISKYPSKEIKIVDFGCGKSYLTFILYYYLTEIKGKTAYITGLDLKEDVIKKCNLTAEKYGYVNLKFLVGDIESFKSEDCIDMVISLHACDTATDYAIYHAISWGAKMIFSIPCCQHELNFQMEAKSSLIGRYGLLKEKFCSLATDTLRGALLEYNGYQTQMLEFVDLSHSPKNILIRAIKQEREISQEQKEKIKSEIEVFNTEYGFLPKLYTLLMK
ncbi:MAG: SAM-dependent methyltransferase [Fusobacteria bacterium]|nr:SAM-dependent methyltransferase [Fusobacteriota bacterium]